MLIVSTTALYCQGDDYIRDGAMRLLNVPKGAAVTWLNRFALQANLPDKETLLKGAQAFILAGTPAWLDNELPWYAAVWKARVPLWLVGIRMCQHNHALLKSMASLVGIATTADTLAPITLEKAGIPNKRFLDPAFHAPYFAAVPAAKKDIDIVFCYRRGLFTGEPDAAHMAAIYEKLYIKFKDRIGAVVVHEPYEVSIAARIFGRKPFYHSEPAAYADVYGRARCFLGGRIHGAIPVLAMGGEAHLLYGNKWGKQKGVIEAGEAGLPVRVCRPEEWDSIVPGSLNASAARSAEIVRADFAAHSAHLRSHLPPIVEECP